VSDLLARVRDEGLLERGRSLLVLYSAGRDSTCLLDVAIRIAGAEAITALHVNYGLREAAAGDERHCAAVCASRQVPLEIRRARRPQNGGNVQAWARRERYAAASELADVSGALIAVGHTATDQVETILYRLASSPSRRALLGMRPREDRLIRPLLGFTREETAEHCRARGLEWREDESNKSHAYARARIRDVLVPALRSIHPAAEANVLALAALLRDEAEVLDQAVDAALSGDDQIPLARLRSLPVAVRRLVVQTLADRAAGAPAPGAARRAEEVCALADHGTAALDLPFGIRALAERGILRFVRTPPNSRVSTS
jgi:tRNA(Ile)-lysidine synthase